MFRNEEAKAARLAREIESNPNSQTRANLENGDEEERYVTIYLIYTMYITFNLNRIIEIFFIIKFFKKYLFII